jgi:hypothetical protein
MKRETGSGRGSGGHGAHRFRGESGRDHLRNSIPASQLGKAEGQFPYESGSAEMDIPG